MIQYLIVARTLRKTNNRLQTAVSELFKTIDREVINVSEIEAFMRRMNVEIKSLHIKYSRCTPMGELTIAEWDREFLANPDPGKIHDIFLHIGDGQFSVALMQIMNHI